MSSRTIYAPGFAERPARSPAASNARQLAIRGRYDAATTTDENSRSWWMSDYFSAKSANSFAVRRTLRMRSRYEVANNPYLFGIANDNATDLIDTGPTLQVVTSDAAYNREVEAAWREWCEEVGYVEKLRTCKLAKSVDGEGFLVLKTVEDLDQPVKLYPCDVEADQVTTPVMSSLADFFVDGITLHPVTGQPVSYHVLRQHPGDFFFADFNPNKADTIKKRYVVQWFLKFRPGQVRGIPIFTSSLDLFSELRAFRKAVLNNAQIAAQYTTVLEQDIANGAPGGLDDDADTTYRPFTAVPIDRGMQAVLPPGMKMSQLDPKQPGTSYEMFQEKCLGEACRPISYPLNLALGTSQKFNFSSAKLDHINYRNGLRVERVGCDKTCNTPVFKEWFQEALWSGTVRPWNGAKTPPHEWHWPGFEPLDPKADADADNMRLAAGQDTWAGFWARRGYDWRDVMKQQAEERKEIERLELTFGEPVKRSETTTDNATTEAANVA